MQKLNLYKPQIKIALWSMTARVFSFIASYKARIIAILSLFCAIGITLALTNFIAWHFSFAADVIESIISFEWNIKNVASSLSMLGSIYLIYYNLAKGLTVVLAPTIDFVSVNPATIELMQESIEREKIVFQKRALEENVIYAKNNTIVNAARQKYKI